QALREEGDGPLLKPRSQLKLFLPTPSARMATYCTCNPCIHYLIFLPTPSARRATCKRPKVQLSCRDVYPRPPRGGPQLSLRMRSVQAKISTHALREEGDGQWKIPKQSGKQISTHALREEGDFKTCIS